MSRKAISISIALGASADYYGSLFDRGIPDKNLLLLVTWESRMLLVMWSFEVLTRTARFGRFGIH